MTLDTVIIIVQGTAAVVAFGVALYAFDTYLTIRHFERCHWPPNPKPCTWGCKTQNREVNE